MSNDSAPKCDCSISENGGAGSSNSDLSSSPQCCLRQRLWWLLRSQEFSDVCFAVGLGSQMKQFHAHKDVLSAGSNVFKSMFSDNWLPERVVDVPDVEPPAFSVLLRFLYTDDVSLTADSVMQVLHAANKYAVIALENRCTDFLEKQISPENVFTLLIQGNLFVKPKLVEACLKLIDDDTQRAVEAEGFTCIDPDTLCSILRRDTLKINEYDLLKAVVRWSEAECSRRELSVILENKRFVLNEALYLIRFPLMSFTEFSSGVALTGLLPDKDLVSLFLYFTNNKTSEMPFNVMPRSSLYLVANRFQYVSDSPYPCDGNTNSVSFTTDHDLQLIGIGMYSCARRTGSYHIIFRLLDSFSCTKTIVEKSWEHTEAENISVGKTIRLMLKAPVELSENQNYRIEFAITGPDSFCGRGGMHNVIMKLPGSSERTVKIKFFHKKFEPFDDDLYDPVNFLYSVNDRDYYNLDDIESGQLPELYFKL